MHAESMKPTLAATGITSDWMGILKSGRATLRFVVHFRLPTVS